MSILNLEELRKKFENYEEIKEGLFIKVSPLSYAETRNAIYHQVEDLAITYHVLLAEEAEGFTSVIITNEMIDNLFGDVSKEKLHMDAMTNSMALFPLDIMEGNHFGFGVDNSKIVTNKSKTDGAAVIFYPGVMDQLAMELGGSYYIIPSSIHEVIVVKNEDAGFAEFLNQTIQKVNDAIVEPCERLSYSAYYYDCVAKKFSKAKK